MNVVIIPARGGSKRIPQKNIKPFLGKPIIAYSIEAALKAPSVDKVIVSTDDEKIAEIAKEYGADVPFKRASDLSDDYVSVGKAFEDAVNWLKQSEIDVNYACCLFATAPLVSASDIEAGLDLLKQHSNIAQVLSVTSFGFPIQRAQRIEQSGTLSYINTEDAAKRSQDLEPMFHDAGQFFWTSYTNPSAKGILPLHVDRYRVQDIDTQEDWQVAEKLYRALHN